VQCAAKFTSEVEIARQDNGQTADGKSILSVLLLAASAGTTLIVKAEGADEEAAAEAIAELIENKFGEEVSDGLY
jgi:phosphocarrier protein